MGDNIKIFKFKQDLEAVINAYELPMMAKRVVLELVLRNVENVSNEILQAELEQLEEKESKDGVR